MGEVKLHGSWASPFSNRVVWALELKGIPYEFVQEDLTKKSPLLLHYNPVYKKIPVLVHGGKPICESSIILEYIDETWPQKPLLPIDPLDRAAARFWIKFIEDKEATMRRIFVARGEGKEEARRESLEVLRTVEERGLGGGGKFFGGDAINMVDLTYGWIAVWMKVLEEVLDMKLIEGPEFPRLQAWAESFRTAAVIRDHIPDHQKMVLHLRRRREELLPPPN
ncbi:glutathione transferase GST 23-like [Cucurbita pepo subsp. pepo]|uniref:glutathione transferase GST 23-like n=1 Tax=Cucurbita pepo subsp. pepo TaxID=3664 RepID=UPI000C9D96D9|nr:glutathione transferase GST 23-like [Cucurbita pepo subsp. pepo]